MKPVLLAALCAAAALCTPGGATSGAAADARCPPMQRGPSKPVYVVLYGYPHMPGEPEQKLAYVDHDLLLMATFFEALGPRRLIVHGEPSPALSGRFGAGLRAPSWRALKATVAELAAEAEPDARIYLYFSGHGSKRRVGSGTVAFLFGRPEPGSEAPGYDGRFHSRQLAAEVLTPLSKRADVHLIADTCMSFFLLAARSEHPGERAIRRLKAAHYNEFEAPFVARFSRVGASLAAYYVTYETREVGGLFSHGLRTAAMGLADIDGDGRISYGELNYGLAWLLRNTKGAAAPVIVSPGHDNDAIFIDWRDSAAVRMCLPATLTGTHVLDTDDGRAASLPLHPLRPSTLWLSADRTYTLGSPGERRTFVARADGPLDVATIRVRASEGAIEGPVLETPIPTPEGPGLLTRPPFEPGWYVAVGATGVGERVQGQGLGDGWAPGAAVAGRFGRGLHRLAVEAGWSTGADVHHAQTRFADGRERETLHLVAGRVGYDHLVVHRGYEFSLAALVGGVQPLVDGADLLLEGTARATTLLPLPVLPTLAVRLDARFSVAPTGDGVATRIQLGLGVDYEFALD